MGTSSPGPSGAGPQVAGPDPLALAMGLGFALMWSSAFTSARIIVADASPLAALALRFAVSGGLAIALAAALGQSWRLTRAQWIAVAVFGVCQNALYLGLYFRAMQTVPASLAAIVASSMPLIVALMGRLVFGRRLTPLAWAGLVGGLAGVVLIMGSRLTGGADPIGLAYCVVGVLALAVATLAVPGTASGGNVAMIVGLQMLVGATVLAAVAPFVEDLSVEPSLRLAVAFAYTLLVPGLAATLVWFALVNRIGTVRASTFHFLNPVFGVAIAAALLGEPVGPVDAVGVAVITLGILAVQIARGREVAATAPQVPAGKSRRQGRG